MSKEKIARELLRIAKGLQAKPEFDFQGIADEIDEISETLDDYMNENSNRYDRITNSQINKSIMKLIDVKNILEDIEPFDNDPFGVVNRGF